MKFRLLISALLSLGLLGAVQEKQSAQTAVEPITVILVRHAEKEADPENPRDPLLSEVGSKRAESLAELLGHADVSHLFSSEFQRTKLTLAPLAAKHKLMAQVIPAGDGAKQIAELKELAPGSVAVVAGHSNTVPALVAGLGGQAKNLVDHPRYGKMLKDSEYGRVFVVTLPGVKGSKPSTIELRY